MLFMFAAGLFLFSCILVLSELSVYGRYGTVANRHAMTGGELARYVLDAGGFPQITVEPLKASPGGPPESCSVKQLQLSVTVYDGRRLLDLAVAALKAADMPRSSPAGVSGTLLGGRFRQFYGLLILVSWVMAASALLGPGWALFARLGAGLFSALGIFAMVQFPSDWDVSQTSAKILAGSRYFEVDEILRLKKIFGVMRFRKFSGLVRAPLAVFVPALVSPGER